jgi:hypothetical protein
MDTGEGAVMGGDVSAFDRALPPLLETPIEQLAKDLQ